MKKQLLSIAACLLILTACHNGNSSGVAEKDDEYSRSFDHPLQKEGHHEATTPAHSKDNTDTKEGMTDSTHLPEANGTHGEEHEGVDSVNHH